MKDNALYLEADEDITSAIDKLSKIPASSVQIVVPKRSTLIQSIINLKLLKKAADTAGKEIVLVTSDRIASDLAARVGLAVAPSVGGKAVKGEAKAAPTAPSEDEVIEASDPLPPINPLASPELAAVPAPASTKSKKTVIKRREVPDEPESDPSVAGSTAQGTTTTTGNSSAAATPNAALLTPDTSPLPPPSAPRVPSFRKLQRRLMWLTLAVVLVGGYFAVMYFLTSAHVVLYANATKTSIDTTFEVDPSATTSSPNDGVLAGQSVTYSKDLNGPITPTGKKDVGTKAAGSVTVANATGTDQPLVAGTRFQAPDGKIFRTGSDIVVPKAYLDSGGDKVNGSATVSVTADENGDTYNEGPTSYAIPALGNPKITASGGQMSGGITKTVTIVTQSDVDAAVSALVEKDQEASARDLSGHTPAGYMGLAASQTSKDSDILAAPAIDAEATTGTVSFKVNYTMLAVKKTDYQAAIKALELKQIGAANQIYDDGLATAQFTLTSTSTTGKATFHLTAEAFSGAKLDTVTLTKSLVGKRYGDAVDLAQRQPSVSHAEVTLNPTWSASLPTRADKITVTIKVATGQK